MSLLLGSVAAFWGPIKQVGSKVRQTILTEVEDNSGSLPTTKPSKGNGDKEAFPRRVLAICISNYLYADTIAYGLPDHNLHSLLEKMHKELHIPVSQIVELSDAAGPRPEKASAETTSFPMKRASRKQSVLPESAPHPPLKALLEKTIAQFLETSRPPDHVILLFCGHVIELEDAAYLVPLDGEFQVKETLVPLSWLYQQLEKCPAHQKVLILDTCRFDPGRGHERPASGPMSAKLDKLLAEAPKGVQVWSSCTADQVAYELDGNSVFLDRLAEALTPKVLGKSHQPKDPLPMDALAAAVSQATQTQIASELKAKQTPRLSGRAAEGLVEYDPNQPELARVEIPPAQVSGTDAAKADEIRSILAEIELPPIRLAREETVPVAVEVLIPFSAKTMDPYRADYASLKEIKRNKDKYPLRIAILDVVKLLREKFDPKIASTVLRDSFGVGGGEKIKKQILDEQKKPAEMLGELLEAKGQLEKAGEERDKEPSRRWQAHYDYIFAELLARIAYLHEYNLMLGKIRKDELPTLENGQSSYRLASREKLQGTKEFREMANESRKLFGKLARQNKATPWEILAKRARMTALGLEWQAAR